VSVWPFESGGVVVRQCWIKGAVCPKDKVDFRDDKVFLTLGRGSFPHGPGYGDPLGFCGVGARGFVW
jgi:hypothetical protein